MEQNLVLFTASFPYKGGEQFLETEIKYLSKKFDNIVIVPAKSNREIRDIEQYRNITIDKYIIKMDRSILNRIKSLFDRKFLLNLGINYFWNRYLAIRVIYINRYLEWIENFEKNYSYNFSNTLFYTYWFEAETIALSIAKRKNPLIKFVTRVHGGDLYEEVHRFKYFPMRREVLENIDRVFPISNRGREYLLQRYKIQNSRVITSKLGVEVYREIAKPLDSKGVNIVSCSNLIEIKRVHLIIEALALLVDRNIEILWSHIGDGILRERLEQMANSKLKHNIKYKFLGHLTNREVYNFYKKNRIDIFINVSRSEGIPVTIMEAQSFGIPCIATDVGANREIVNSANGVLLKPNPTPEEIAKIVIEYNIDIWSIKRVNSINNQRENYNASINYNRFCNLLKDIYYE